MKHICITNTTYYIITQGVSKTCPHTTLHNMGDHLDPQNKRGISNKIYECSSK